MEQEPRIYCGNVDFNVYLEDENGENRKEVMGVQAVELPKCSTDHEGRTTIEGGIKIVFRGTGDALSLLQRGERVLKIYAAEQYLGRWTREFEIERRDHVIVPDWDAAVFYPGTVVSADNAVASLEYPVREYRMLCDGKEIFRAETDETA